MSLKDKLNGKQPNDDSKKKPLKKKAIKKKKSITSPSKSTDKIGDPKLLEYIEDILLSEPLTHKPVNNIDKLCDNLNHYIGEWLQTFVLVGYTYDGKLIEIRHASTPMDEQALDGAIHNLYAARAALNGVEIKNRVQKFLTNDEEQY